MGQLNKIPESVKHREVLSTSSLSMEPSVEIFGSTEANTVIHRGFNKDKS